MCPIDGARRVRKFGSFALNSGSTLRTASPALAVSQGINGHAERNSASMNGPQSQSN